jgi:hypothetical protein
LWQYELAANFAPLRLADEASEQQDEEHHNYSEADLHPIQFHLHPPRIPKNDTLRASASIVPLSGGRERDALSTHFAWDFTASPRRASNPTATTAGGEGGPPSPRKEGSHRLGYAQDMYVMRGALLAVWANAVGARAAAKAELRTLPEWRHPH